MIKDFIYRLIAFVFIVILLPVLLILLAFDILILNNDGNFFTNYIDKWRKK